MPAQFIPTCLCQLNGILVGSDAAGTLMQNIDGVWMAFDKGRQPAPPPPPKDAAIGFVEPEKKFVVITEQPKA